MPKTALTTAFVRAAACPAGQRKVDFFDEECKGLLLEVRTSGGKTFYLRYQDSRGRTHQMKLADALDVSLGQARTLADKHRNQLAMGEDPLANKAAHKAVPTLAQFMQERYVPYVQGYKKSWAGDVASFRLHLLPALGHKFLDEITKDDVIALHQGMRKRGLAPGTCNRCLILLRYCLNLAMRWGVGNLRDNPSRDVPLFDEPLNKERFLSEAEAQTLLECVRRSENPMLQYIVPMLILTGARKREVLDARWNDIDLERRQWKIPVTKSGKPRFVPLSAAVVELMALVPKYDDVPWIFANPKTGKPYVHIFATWNTARKQAGLADVRMHDLRHSFASFLVNAGRSLYEVQRILGHSQIKTTQRYAHLSQDTLLEAANVVPLSLQ